MTTIVSMDPGKATGFSVWSDCEKIVQDSLMPVALEAPDFTTACTFLENMTMRCLQTPNEWDGQVHFISESYIISSGTARQTQSNWSLELIGVMRYLAERHDFEFTLQTPANAKIFSTDEKMKRMAQHSSKGWWHPTAGGHANDSLRHLLLFMSKRSILTTDDMRHMIGGQD